jgi:hypothetical protein
VQDQVLKLELPHNHDRARVHAGDPMADKDQRDGGDDGEKHGADGDRQPKHANTEPSKQGCACDDQTNNGESRHALYSLPTEEPWQSLTLHEPKK